MKEYPFFPGQHPDKIKGKSFETIGIDIHVVKNGKIQSSLLIQDWSSALNEIEGKPRINSMNPKIKPAEALTEIPTSIGNLYETILGDVTGKGQNLSFYLDSFHEDLNSRPNPLNPSGNSGPGAEGKMNLVALYAAIIPNMKYERQFTFLCGDKITVVSKFSGTITTDIENFNHLPFFPGVPPEKLLGKKFVIRALDIHVIREGKIKQEWNIKDYTSALQQMLNGESPPSDDFGFDQDESATSMMKIDKDNIEDNIEVPALVDYKSNSNDAESTTSFTYAKDSSTSIMKLEPKNNVNLLNGEPPPSDDFGFDQDSIEPKRKVNIEDDVKVPALVEDKIISNDTESTTSFTYAKDSTTSSILKLESKNNVNIGDDMMVSASEQYPKTITSTTAPSFTYYPVLFAEPKNNSKPKYSTTVSSYVKKVLFRPTYDIRPATASPPKYMKKQKAPYFFRPTGSPEYVPSPIYSDGSTASRPTTFVKNYSPKSSYKGVNLGSYLRYLYEMGSKSWQGWQAAFGDVISRVKHQSRKWKKRLNQ